MCIRTSPVPSVFRFETRVPETVEWWLTEAGVRSWWLEEMAGGAKTTKFLWISDKKCSFCAEKTFSTYHWMECSACAYFQIVFCFILNKFTRVGNICKLKELILVNYGPSVYSESLIIQLIQEPLTAEYKIITQSMDSSKPSDCQTWISTAVGCTVEFFLKEHNYLYIRTQPWSSEFSKQIRKFG